MTEHPTTAARITVEPFPPPPVCWPTLAPEQSAEQLTALTAWISWLIERYGLDHRTLPACWHQHGALVEELSALHSAWSAAYAQTAPATTPLDWHANFAGARQRVQDWVATTGCRPGEHR